MKQFIVDRHTTPGSAALDPVAIPKVPVYDTLADAEADLSNLAVNQIIAITPTDAEMLGRVILDNGVKKIQALTANIGVGAPVGTIIAQYKKSNPSGYLYLDGSTFNATVYPALYAYLGSNVLPDYREFALVGAEQNTTDTIAAHDVYTQGQAKDDQLQDHIHNGRIYNADGSGSEYSLSMAKDKYMLQSTPFNQGVTSGYRVGSVTRGKRKAVYFYIKATSGLAENQQENVLATINENNSYSTTEQPTGAKWIDGKPIYRKVIDFGVLPNSNTKTVNHNIANLGHIINLHGYTTNGTIYFPIPYAGNIAENTITCSVYSRITHYTCRICI